VFVAAYVCLHKSENYRSEIVVLLLMMQRNDCKIKSVFLLFNLFKVKNANYFKTNVFTNYVFNTRDQFDLSTVHAKDTF